VCNQIKKKDNNQFLSYTIYTLFFIFEIFG